MEFALGSHPSLTATLCFSFNRDCVCSPHTASLFALVRAKKSHPAVSKHLLESPLYKSLIRVPVSNQGRSAQSKALHARSNHLATEGGGISTTPVTPDEKPGSTHNNKPSWQLTDRAKQPSERCFRLPLQLSADIRRRANALLKIQHSILSI